MQMKSMTNDARPSECSHAKSGEHSRLPQAMWTKLGLPAVEVPSTNQRFQNSTYTPWGYAKAITSNK